MNAFGVGTVIQQPLVICLSNLPPDSEPLRQVADRLESRGIAFDYEYYSIRTGFALGYAQGRTAILVALDEEHPQTFMPFLGPTPSVFWLTKRVVHSARSYGTLPIVDAGLLRVEDGERLENYDEVVECLSLFLEPSAEIVQLPELAPEGLVALRPQWDEILEGLEKNFSEIYGINPRKFEELTAELFTRDGFKAELTQAQKDGGYDVLVYHESALGNYMSLVECKRFGPTQRVGVGIVRSLFGVLGDSKATSAILVTTAEFTRSAREFEAGNPHRLILHDHRFLHDWIKRIRSR